MAESDINRSISAMSSPIRVGLLLYPRCMPAGLFAFTDLVQAANHHTGRTLFEIQSVALHSEAVDCAHDMPLTAAATFDDTAFDAILIPGFWAESPQHVADALVQNADLVSALTGLPKKVKLWSYCTGVCLLAATDKLRGDPATVTWWLANAMRKWHPGVLWQSEQNCVVNERTATATGVHGYMQIAQLLIEQHVSAEVFRDLANLMVLPRPMQAHGAFQSISLIGQSDRMLRKLHSLVEELPANDITVQRLAKELNTSERTLARRVATETGYPVAAHARRIKLNQVSERLISTSIPASTISAELGFSSDSSMRRMFKKITALTPSEYRLKFGRK